MRINPRVFWGNVKALREDSDLTQVEFSEMIGVKYRSYNNIEKFQTSKVTMALAQKVAEALETSVEALATGEVPDEPLVDPEVANFWRNAKARRESLNLSQGDVAERLQMNPKNYQAKESCRAVTLSNSLALQVAEALECTVEELRENESKTIDEEDANASKTEDSIKTETLNNKPLYDIGHLEEYIQKFISDKKNEKRVKESIKDLIIRDYMEKE